MRLCDRPSRREACSSGVCTFARSSIEQGCFRSDLLRGGVMLSELSGSFDSATPADDPDLRRCLITSSQGTLRFSVEGLSLLCWGSPVDIIPVSMLLRSKFSLRRGGEVGNDKDGPAPTGGRWRRCNEELRDVSRAAMALRPGPAALRAGGGVGGGEEEKEVDVLSSSSSLDEL